MPQKKQPTELERAPDPGTSVSEGWLWVAVESMGMRMREALGVGCVTAVLLLSAAPVPAATVAELDAAEQLPNLVPLPPFDVEVGAPDDGERGGPPVGALRFATAVANRGEWAFDLFGQPENPGAQTAKAMQCVGWASERVCIERSEVGRIVWHPEHAHHHFEDFALYELRKLKPNGQPILKPKGLVAGGTKVSFCLMDIEPDDGTSGGPNTPIGRIGHPLYMSCAAGSGFQGISAGWRDVYGNSTPGQQIVLDGVPDGTYALVVTTDPEELILETTKADNVAVTGVVLTGGGSQVQVVCESEPGTTKCLPLEQTAP